MLPILVKSRLEAAQCHICQVFGSLKQVTKLVQIQGKEEQPLEADAGPTKAAGFVLSVAPLSCQAMSSVLEQPKGGPLREEVCRASVLRVKKEQAKEWKFFKF